jgi:hypothetical protein
MSIVSMMLILTRPRFKQILPPNLQNLSQRDVVIFSIVVGTISGVIYASILWFILHRVCKSIFGIYRECFEEVEKDEDEKTV